MRVPFLNHKESNEIRTMQFWGGVPISPSSKWRRMLRLVQKCVERGWKTTVVFSQHPYTSDLEEPFLDAGAEILIQQRSSSSLKLGAVLKTYRFFHRHPCDLIHCHNRPVIPLLAASLNNVPVRVWSRLAMSSHYEENSIPKGIHKLQINSRLSCFLSDKILCISQPVLNELSYLSDSIKDKSVVGGVGFDLNLYAHGLSENIRKEFALSANDLILVSVGHAVPVKGWDILLRAYAQFRKKIPQSKLLLVGSIEQSHEKETLQLLLRLIDTLSLENQVILTGKRSEIPDFLATADIYLQPSRSEGLCVALVEALAAGLPCIAANVGGIPDVIQDGKNGLLFDREDVNGLAEKMLSLAQNSDLRKSFSRKALSSIQRYELETVTDTILTIYSELLTKRGVLRA